MSIYEALMFAVAFATLNLAIVFGILKIALTIRK